MDESYNRMLEWSQRGIRPITGKIVHLHKRFTCHVLIDIIKALQKVQEPRFKVLKSISEFKKGSGNAQ